MTDISIRGLNQTIAKTEAEMVALTSAINPVPGAFLKSDVVVVS